MLRSRRLAGDLPQKKWGPALLPAPTAPSEGSAGIRNLVHFGLSAQPDPLSILAHQLRRRIPPNNSLFRGARSTYSTARPEGSLVFRSFRPGILEPKFLEAKTVQCSAALLGKPSIASRFAHHRSEDLQEPRRATGRFLFRRLFPAGPVRTRRLFPILPAEIGPLVTCRALLALSDLPRRPGPPSRSPLHHAHPLRVAKAKNAVLTLWITGISGTISGTFSHSPNRPRFGCRSVLPGLPRKRA